MHQPATRQNQVQVQVLKPVMVTSIVFLDVVVRVVGLSTNSSRCYRQQRQGHPQKGEDGCSCRRHDTLCTEVSEDAGDGFAAEDQRPVCPNLA